MATAAASVVAAGAVTVGTAFVLTAGSSAPVARVPAPRVDVVAAAGGQPSGTVLPSSRESEVIADAVRSSSLTAAVAPGSYQVSGTVLARSDESWAWAELVPVAAETNRAEAVLHHGDAGWELVQLGSYEVGCGIVPDPVAADLELECPDDAPGYDA